MADHLQTRTAPSACRVRALVVLVLVAFAAGACSGGDETAAEASATTAAVAGPGLTAATTSVPATTAVPAPTSTTRPTAAASTTEATDSAVSASSDNLLADVAGRWEGVTTVPGLGELPFSVDIAVTGSDLSGTMDIQGNVGLPLSGFAFDGSNLHFELQSPLGLATWDGEVGDGAIEGVFDQLGNEGTFRLHRPGAESGQPADSVRDTEFHAEEVTFASGAFTLTGELLLPLGSGPHPAVVLINGSGAQDRDSTVAGFPLFGELAEHLAGLGIASLRWDDRGMGDSSGSDALSTLDGRAGDAGAALALLESRGDVDGERIGLLGHSEGAYIAPIVASRSDGIAFVALLASPAVPGDELLRTQLPRVLTAAGVPADEIERHQARQALSLQAVMTGEGWAEVERSYRQLARRQLEDLSDDARESIPDEEYFIDTVVQDELRTLRSPWFSSLVQYDPRPDLIGLRVPVLALFGELDTQVPLDLNMPALSEALAASDAASHTIETVAQANHLFQTAVTGSLDEYAELEPAFAPDFLQQLGNWLTTQISR